MKFITCAILILLPSLAFGLDKEAIKPQEKPAELAKDVVGDLLEKVENEEKAEVKAEPENKPEEKKIEKAATKNSTNKRQGNDVVKSGLPVPRFVSLKSREANIRVGPGVDYPIKFVYKRATMPVEVIAEFGNWRQIRDMDGADGWALHSLLTGKRFAIVTKESVMFNVYKGDRAVMRLGENVQVEVKKCEPKQCEVKYGGTKGWVDKTNLWGVYADEEFD